MNENQTMRASSVTNHVYHRPSPKPLTVLERQREGEEEPHLRKVILAMLAVVGILGLCEWSYRREKKEVMEATANEVVKKTEPAETARTNHFH
jgi:hypothetical protein